MEIVKADDEDKLQAFILIQKRFRSDLYSDLVHGWIGKDFDGLPLASC